MSSTARALAMAAGLALACAFGLSACSDAPPSPEPSALDANMADTTAQPEAQASENARPAMRPAQTRAPATPANRPPRIRSLSIEPAQGDETTWVAVVEAEDAEGDAIELDYTWFVNDEPTTTEGARFDASGQGRGDRFHVEVTPRDRHGIGSVAATGKVEVANAAPSITSQPPARMAGGVYRYIVEASDPEGDAPLRYELLQSPDGMRIDPYTGELQWRPASNQAGKHTIEIAVSDNRGGRSTQLFDLPITSPGA